MNKKPASTNSSIHTLLAGRWSPRAFSSKPVTPEQTQAMLEAARWAPSSFNLQPWRFIVCDRNRAASAYKLAFDGLVPFNQNWVGKNVPLLIVVCARTINADGRTNHNAQYDTGAASFALTLQAHALGLAAHQMSGIDAERLRANFSIPDEFLPLTMIAVGYHGDMEELDPELREREQAARQRVPLNDIAYSGGWGVPLTRSAS